MNKLVIITGISGSGKTTIAREVLNKQENITFISLDTMKENLLFDIIGYHNEEQRDRLEMLKWDVFWTLLQECMDRQDPVIMVEYPFRTRVTEKFNTLIERHHYDALTVSVQDRDFDAIWQRKCKRDSSPSRHLGHLFSKYDPVKKVGEGEMLKADRYEILKQEYQDKVYNSIMVGEKIEFCNETGKSREIIVDKIGRFIKKE